MHRVARGGGEVGVRIEKFRATRLVARFSGDAAMYDTFETCF